MPSARSRSTFSRIIRRCSLSARGRTLHCSLWSHNERLGHADLKTPSDDPEQRSGIFEPEPPFERIEPLLSALERAMMDFEADAPLPSPDELAALPRSAQVALIREALGAGSSVRRMVESQRAVDAFALQLRDDQDREVPTQFITVHRLPDVPAGRVSTADTPLRHPRYLIVTRLEDPQAY